MLGQQNALALHGRDSAVARQAQALSATGYRELRSVTLPPDWLLLQSPKTIEVGIDPIVLGVLITVVIGVGLVTPPVGMCLYVAADLMDLRVGKVTPYLLPYIAVTFLVIALLIAFPQLITVPGSLIASGA